MSMTFFFIEKLRGIGPVTRRFGADQRGMSMTEAVIVLPVFVLVWMGLVYLHGLFLGRLEAQVSAHRVAFSGAMVGDCPDVDEGAGQGAEETGRAGEDPVRAAIDEHTAAGRVGSVSEQAQRSLDADGGGNSLFDWSHYTTVSRVTLRAVPRTLGGPEKTASGEARVLCNMKPAGGLGEAFYDMVKGWFD